MRSCRSFLFAPGLLASAVVFGFAACGSASGGPTNGDAGAGDGDGRIASGGAVGEAGSSGAGGTASEASVGGEGGEGGASEAGGAGGSGSEGGEGGESEGGNGGESGARSRVVCDATVQDAPDDDFRDTNCDGIDGDAAHAVFVAPTGNDTAAGTMSAPVRSINHALALAAERKFSVYVCNGTYKESVVVAQGARIYGGYDCARDWVRVKDRAIVHADAGLPVSIDSVAEAVVIERIAFRAAGASQTSSGASSQAGAINDSSQVLLSHVEFTAGDGAPGISGMKGVDALKTPPLPGGAGADAPVLTQDGCELSALTPECASYAAGGSGAQSACRYNNGMFWLEGGNGGDGGNLWLAQGQPACVNDLDSNGLSAGYSVDGALGGTGRIHPPGRGWSALAGRDLGRPGKDGVSGAGASAGIGSLRGALYFATNDGSAGTWGEPGMPGAGGKGGRSTSDKGFYCLTSFIPGSGGGQGGLGGCGGGGASAGTGGGGSIALVIDNSHVELTWVSITTGRGGDGGAGAAGGKGQPGGAAGLTGAAFDSYQGTDGAPGGEGGLGGASGPGGGGPSVGILYVGAAPKVTEGTFDIGVPGSGGVLAGGGAAPIGVTGELYQLAQ